MTKTQFIDTVIDNFKKEYENTFVKYYKIAIKNNDECCAKYILNNDGTVISALNESSNELSSDKAFAYVLCMFDPYFFNAKSISLNDVVEYLTEKEKTACLKHINSFLDNDDYLYYSLSMHMLQFMCDYCEDSLDKYLDTVIKNEPYVQIDGIKFNTLCVSMRQYAAKLFDEYEQEHKYKNRDIKTELTKEHNDLYEKIKALNNFFNTNTFQSLTQVEQTLLKSQLKAMLKYDNALKLRIAYYKEN